MENDLMKLEMHSVRMDIVNAEESSAPQDVRAGGRGSSRNDVTQP